MDETDAGWAPELLRSLGYPTRRPVRGSEATPKTVTDRMLLSFRDLNPVAFGVLHVVILFPGVPIYAFPCVVGDVVFAYFSPRDVAGGILTDGG
jgi:hypothetical protein